MTDSHHGAHAEAAHAGVHVVPMRVLLLVWGALMVLTWVTVSVTYIDLGNLNIMIALGIAVIKSSFVVLYFMHLRYDNPFNAVIFISSILFVMLFIGFALIDRAEYAPELIPGYAPAMEQMNSTAEGAPASAAGAAPATSTTGSATPAGAAVADSAQAGADSGHAATSTAAAADSGTPAAAAPKTPTGH